MTDLTIENLRQLAFQSQQIRDREVVTQLGENHPELRRYVSHHIRNDAQILVGIQAMPNCSPEISQAIDIYLDRLSSKLEAAGL